MRSLSDVAPAGVVQKRKDSRAPALNADGSPTIIQEGFVWVMSSTTDRGIVRLGSSLNQPPQPDQNEGLEWRLDYYARVADRQQAHAAASNFLSPFRRHQNIYETDAVVAATAIENSASSIQFRKTSFGVGSKTDDNGISSPTNVPAIASTDDFADDDGAEDIAEQRAERQRAMAKLLYDAEQLLVDSELVTGPIGKDRIIPLPLNESKSSGASGQTAPGSRIAADSLNIRSPMQDLLGRDAGASNPDTDIPASDKTKRVATGTSPASVRPPPPPPRPLRAQPATQHGDLVKIPDAAAKTQQTEAGDAKEKETGLSLREKLAKSSLNITGSPESAGSTDDRIDDDDSLYETAQSNTVDPVSEFEPTAETHEALSYREPAVVHEDPDEHAGAMRDDDENRTILMQMENIIIQREARQNLRAIRSRIGRSTLKGIAFGALAGLLLILALNVPADSALLVGFLLIGGLIGAAIMGIYQSTRLWGSATHWRRVARHV